MVCVSEVKAMPIPIEVEAMNAVAIHDPPPPFWMQAPELWFAQLEARFSLANIDSDESRFNFTILSLDCEQAVLVKDVIRGPWGYNKYEMLKNCLISKANATNNNN